MAHANDGSGRFSIYGIQTYMFELDSDPEQGAGPAEAEEEPQHISPSLKTFYL